MFRIRAKFRVRARVRVRSRVSCSNPTAMAESVFIATGYQCLKLLTFIFSKSYTTLVPSSKFHMKC